MDFIVQSFKRGDAVVASPFLYLKTKSDGNVSHWLCRLVQPPGDEHIFQHRFFVPYQSHAAVVRYSKTAVNRFSISNDSVLFTRHHRHSLCSIHQHDVQKKSVVLHPKRCGIVMKTKGKRTSQLNLFTTAHRFGVMVRRTIRLPNQRKWHQQNNQ